MRRWPHRVAQRLVRQINRLPPYGETGTAAFLCVKGSPKRRTLYHSGHPVMGLVQFLAGRLVGGLAEPLNGFPFLLYRIAYMADVWLHVSIWRNIAIYSEIPNEPDAGVLSKTVDGSCNNETCQTPSDPFQEV